MDELWLVCEGEPASVDVAVLQPVFARVLTTQIVVEPACGSSPNVVARFLEIRRGGRAAFLIDRDYRPRADAEAAMRDGGPGFIWRRHSVKNYLLQPPIILRAFQRLRELFERRLPGRVPAWLGHLPTDQEQIIEAIRQCASRRAAQESCRHANHRLWASRPSAVGNIQRRDPDIGDNAEPNDWREALCQEVQRVAEAVEQTGASHQFERENAVVLFDASYAELTASPYVTQMEFLIDFHGRDLLKEFRLWLDARGVHFSYKRLCNELINASVQEYESNRMVYGQDDFLHLANGVLAFARGNPLA